MKKAILISALLAAATASLAGFAAAQSTPATAPETATVNSIRGVDPDSDVTVNPVYHQEEGRKNRNYRAQPPIIPHTIEKYQIDLHANECLACHDWKNAADRRAPTLSMTHYTSRDGVQTDTVAPRRWFCNQCHVPQVDAPALVDNIFKGSEE